MAHHLFAADLVLTERDRRHKVLHLEVFDKGVIGIESTRRPRQSVALKTQLFPNFGPLFRVAGNGRTHSGQNPVVRMPDACRGETIVGFKVQIENWRMSILAAGMRKVDADVRLEWPLVIGEAGVSIDTKQ